MTQAADRLRKFSRDELGLTLSEEEAESMVKAVFNADHETYSTLEERFLKAIEVELSMAFDPPDKGLFIARCILLRTGLEHQVGNLYKVPEGVGSVVSGPDWAVRLTRKLDPEEWTRLSGLLHGEFEQTEGKMTVERFFDILSENFQDVTVVETIRRERTP